MTRVERGVREFREADLPPGEVEIRVDWSSVNYKDGLATRADGKVARISPLIPGIDLAGEVVGIGRSRPARAAAPSWPTATSWASRATAASASTSACRPAGSCRWRPACRHATRCRSGRPASRRRCPSSRSRSAGSSPDDGPGARDRRSGGVGGTALAILADRGYEVWAATGKPDEADRLRTLGAAGILTRDEVTAEGTAARIGALGRAPSTRSAAATLPYVLRTLQGRRRGRRRPATPAAPALETTVFPFILRGVALLGMDSVNMPIARRRELWDRLATDLRPRDLGVHCTEVTLDTLDEALDGIVAGDARGRWIVRIGE